MSDRELGLYEKYIVRRTDGGSLPGRRHFGCHYFVLDLSHDPHARPALLAYADSADRDGFHALATDLRRIAGAGEGTSDPEEVMSPEPEHNTDAGLPVAPPAPEPLPSVDDVIALADEFAYAVERHINIESKLRNLRAAIERLHSPAPRRDLTAEDVEHETFTALRGAWPRPPKGAINREVAMDRARAKAVAARIIGMLR